MRWKQGWIIGAAVIGTILILWSGKSEQPPSGWEPMQFAAQTPTLKQEPTVVESAVLGQNSELSTQAVVEQATPVNAGVNPAGGSEVSSTVQGKVSEEKSPDVVNTESATSAAVANTSNEIEMKPEQQVASPPEQQVVDNGKIDINSAPVSKLTELPGIGEKKAQAIVDYRNTHGPFARVSDLTKVKGIGMKMLEKMAPYVQIR
ncbi:helix-hairpin-helix domain-containing protein [Paenibacillus sp. ACRSA]|uniref:ComEA family DNA-binding protein n=1 Tax=Paenibacillus sp. ACRSA TaxID=2918211 RepID=UPI001EF5CB9A|nr:ComEA family DNA-binding protein [Paenibacillus sp. ACRSA]MCG7376010.1 helix-hairpin-helix domain-containing protein [Paenibacillus sp. ACRSA]